MTPDWVSRCLFLNEFVDVQSNPLYFVSEWDLYYEMNNSLENYKACKPNENHDWYPYYKEAMEQEKKNKGVKTLTTEEAYQDFLKMITEEEKPKKHNLRQKRTPEKQPLLNTSEKKKKIKDSKESSEGSENQLGK